MFHFCVTEEALSLLLQKWSEMLQYGLTYTMQTWFHIYDAIRCEPTDVSGYLIRTSGCPIWHDLTSLCQTSKKMDRYAQVAMLQLAIMNHRLFMLDDEVQARQRRKAKRFCVRPWLSADRRLQFLHYGQLLRELRMEANSSILQLHENGNAHV